MTKRSPSATSAILCKRRLTVPVNEYRENAFGVRKCWLRGRGAKKLQPTPDCTAGGSPIARRPVVSDYYCSGFIPLVVNYTVHRNRVYVPARALSNISPGVHLQRILHRTGRKTGACAARLEIKSYRSSAPMNSLLFFFFFSAGRSLVPLFLSPSPPRLSISSPSCEIYSVEYCLCTAPYGDYVHARPPPPRRNDPSVDSCLAGDSSIHRSMYTVCFINFSRYSRDARCDLHDICCTEILYLHLLCRRNIGFSSNGNFSHKPRHYNLS